MQKQMAAVLSRATRLKSGLCRTLVLAVSLLAGSAAFAGPADVTKGLNWLQAQIQVDGQILSESKVAALQQVRCESATTILKLVGNTTQVAVLLTPLKVGGPDVPTETVACAQQLRQQIGETILAPEVELRHIERQAYGVYEGDSMPSVLDSGWALSAQLQNLAAVDKERLLTWLQTNQGADGSFAVSGMTNLLATAAILRGLQPSAPQNPMAATIASKAAAYLLGRKSATGDWNTDPSSTALVYEAVHPYTAADPTIASTVASYLLGKQSADGSWGGDAYVTAVALRALVLTGQPALDPTLAGLSAKFVDARNNNALPGVALTALNSSDVVGSSDAAGRIEQRALAAGSYQLQATLNGYATLNFSVTLQAGQILDAGVLQMLVPASASVAVVSGVVREQSTNLPIAGVTVSVDSQSRSAVTAADGRYLISNVAPGSLTVSATKSGFASVAASANALAGQVLNFSPLLTPSSAAGVLGDCKVQGVVTDATTRQALASVSVNISGAATQSTVTDGSGRFSMAGLASGLVTLVTAKAGYDSVSVSTRLACSPDRATLVDFSPRMYLASQTPANANKSGLSGVVLDARTNQPIAGAALRATPDVSAAVNAVTAADGSFRIEGLNGAGAEFEVTATGYQGVTLQFALTPLQVTDLGQVRLRPPKVEQLLPDLKLMVVKRANAHTDPQSLQLIGTVEVDISNVGTQSAPSGVVVLAFSDVNRNAAFDAASDLVLGQATLNTALAPGQSATVSITVSGTLAFRDAPISVMIDPSAQLPELSKANNLRSSADDALRAVGNPGIFDPKLKWSWSGAGDPYPEFSRVMSVPTVGRLVDSNGDGRIDSNDVPVLCFSAYANKNYTGEGVIRIVRGDTGALIRSIRDPALISGATGVTLADIDGDGKPDIVAATTDNRVIAFRNDGTRMWLSDSVPNRYSPEAAITVADLDGDGKPVVIFLGSVFSASNGQRLWKSSGGETGSAYPGEAYVSAPVAADLTGDGKQDVIFGAAVYKSDGTLKWAHHDGYAAVADLDGDGKPEVIVVFNSMLYVYHADGTLVWNVALNTAFGGGPPVIADFDGDGVPDIGVSGSRSYSVYRADGSLLWQKPAVDGSAITGSTVFDFDGDGRAEVLYADETSFRVFDGTTGTERFNIPNASGTIIEYPIVADVDGDGQADMVVVANDLFGPLSPNGMRVFSSPDWVGARSVWNQHAYSINNINDDLSIPINPVPSWRDHNTFRLNKRIDGDPRALADLTVGYMRIQDGGASAGSTVTFRVGNAGGYGAPPNTKMAVYATTQAGARSLLATVAIGVAANPGEFADLTLPVANLGAYTTLTAVADDDGTGTTSIADFDRTNNTLAGDLSAIAVNLGVAVSASKAVYTDADQATFTATVANRGSFVRDASVRFTVLDATGRSVSVLPLGGTVTVAAGGNAPVTTLWSAAGVLSGNYQIKAELVTPLGLVYASASASFAIQASQSQTNSARITVDRVSYTAAQTVQLSARVANLTANTVQDNLSARTTVRNAANQLVLDRSESIVQLVPGAQRQYSYNLAASGLPAGSYSAQLQLLNAQGAVLAQSTSTFSVQSSDQSGIGITGTMQASPTPVAIGQNVSLSLSASNNGNAALLNAPITVRLIEPASGNVLATFTNSANLLARWDIGATQNLQWNWPATGQPDQDVVAAASVRVGGKDISLGQATIRLLKPIVTEPVLTGTITATPASTAVGNTVIISATALNKGDADLTNVALTVSIVDPATQRVVATWPYTAAIARGQSYAIAASWKATDGPNTFAIKLGAVVGGKSISLGSTSLAVTMPLVKLDVTQRSLRQGRLLVLLSCRNREDQYNSDQQSRSAHGNDDRDEDYECGDDDDQCNTTRAAYLNSLLNTATAGQHLVTSKVDDFAYAMRSGQYNIYWIAGGADKLTDGLAQEIREAVNRGDGLLVDGIHDERNKLLDEVVGLEYRGKLKAVNQPITVTVAPMTGRKLQTIGRSIKLKLGNGALIAKFPAGIACHDCDDDDDRKGTSQTDNTAIAAYLYGRGKGIVMAFDLIGSLQKHALDPNWVSLVQVAFDFLTPDAPSSYTRGAYSAVRTTVANQASSVDLNVTHTLPTGAKALAAAPAATVSANGQQAQWNFNLGAAQSKDLTLYLRLPASTGSYSLGTAVSSVVNGQSSLYGNYSLALQVTGAGDAVATTKLIADLNALTFASNKDRQSRDKAVKAIKDAIAQSKSDRAITNLLDAVDNLRDITGKDMATYRLQLDRWLQELSVQWQAAQPVRNIQ